MSTSRLVEALLEGAMTSGLCPDLPALPGLCSRTTGEVLPLQYLLLVRDQPRLRTALRTAAESLLTLLEVADQAYAHHEGPRGCGKFRALSAAPAWVQRPSCPDDSDPDVALIWDRQVAYGGDWLALLEALHRAGSREWQWAIRRCRTLMRFERATGIDLVEAVGAPQARPAPSLACAQSKERR